MGSREASLGAPTATRASTARMTAPTIAPRWRASRRATPARTAGASADADPRIDEAIGDIDERIDQHVAGGDEQHGALHEREVLGEDAADDEAPEPRAAEDGLHDDGAGQEVPELQAEDRDDGDERVLEGVAHDDTPPREALGPRGAHVVLAEHLEHARASEPRDDGRGDGAERHGGQDEVGEVAAPGGGEPAEMQREDEDEEEAEPEARHRHTEESDRHRADVEPRVPAERRHEAEGHAERNGDEHGREGELRGAADVLRDLGRHRPAAADRGAEVAPEGIANEAPVLHEDRLVQVEL